MTEVTEQKTYLPAKLGALLGGLDANDDLSEGVGTGFAVVSFRGAKWRVKHGGEENLITNKDGEAAPSITAVILKANRHISKNYYAGKYVEGSIEPPTCWSVDGVKPDAAVPQPVSPLCANCKNNIFGSRVTDDGRKAKACADTRRLAIVPADDLGNEIYGGPMLLRVPPASLAELAEYGKVMKAKGFPYNTLVTRIGFDSEVSYPKLVFKPVRAIKPDEEDRLIELLNTPEWVGKIDTVLARAAENTLPPPVTPVQPVAPVAVAAPAAPQEVVTPPAPPAPRDVFAFEDETPVQAPVKKVAAKKTVTTVTKTAPVKAEAMAEVGEVELDQEIDAILGKLDDI